MKNANAYVEISGEFNTNCIKRRSSRVALYLYVKIVYFQSYLPIRVPVVPYTSEIPF